MIRSDQSLGLFKVGTYKWMKRLHDLGEVSFSNAGNFIAQAKVTKNIEQGDENEAVFARLRQDDERINEMKALLGSDLEIIPDKGYYLLRRKSSKLIPIFCMYTIRDIDFNDQLNHKGLNTVHHNLPTRIYDGFSDSFSKSNILNSDAITTTAFFQASPFFALLDYSLNIGNYKFKRNTIDYSIMSNDEFFIPPTTTRDELFVKRPQYRYQNEVRYVITNYKMITIAERLNITCPPVNIKDKHLFCNMPISIRLVVKAERL